MRAAALLLAAALLSACAFWSDRPLFAESDAVAPFADGARFSWIENGTASETVVYRRVGAHYALAPVGADDEPMSVWFFEVRETSEEDYVAMVDLGGGDESRAYAFMWRTEQGYRLVAAPAAVEAEPDGALALAAHCAARPNGECRFDRGEDVIALYRRAVYPGFVVAGRTPGDYIDQIADGAVTEAE